MNNEKMVKYTYLDRYQHTICGLAVIFLISDKKLSYDKILTHITIAVFYRRANSSWQVLR